VLLKISINTDSDITETATWLTTVLETVGINSIFKYFFCLTDQSVLNAFLMPSHRTHLLTFSGPLSPKSLKYSEVLWLAFWQEATH